MVQGTQQQAQPVQVGTSLPRLDGPDKVTGRARYAGDQVLAGMLYGRLVLSPYAHARIVSIDTSAALAVPGVVAVFTAETLGMSGSDPLSRLQSPLAHEEVLWCGHPVAVVVGETEASAGDGAAILEVEYEPLPVVIDPEAALQPDAPPVRVDREFPAATGGSEHGAVSQQGTQVGEEEQSPNVTHITPVKMGDIEVGLREAEVVVEYSYRTHPVHQSYMEPHTVTVSPGPSEHHVVVWSSSQGLFMVRSAVARALAVPARQVHVEPAFIGGGFGGKETLLEPLAAAIAARLRKPVRLIYTRQEDLLAGNPAPQTVIRVKLGAKREGTLTAIQARMVVDTGAYSNFLAGFSAFHFTAIYRCPHIEVHCDSVQTNKPGTGSYRAPFGPQAYFALESTVQELCQRLGMDPLEFRRINGFKEGDADFRRGRWPRIGLLACLEQIEQHPLWRQREQVRQEVPQGLKGWKIGTGLAVGGWSGGTEPAAALCRL